MNKQGFLLMEVLIATAIMMIMAVALASAFKHEASLKAVAMTKHRTLLALMTVAQEIRITKNSNKSPVIMDDIVITGETQDSLKLQNYPASLETIKLTATVRNSRNKPIELMVSYFKKGL